MSAPRAQAHPHAATPAAPPVAAVRPATVSLTVGAAQTAAIVDALSALGDPAPLAISEFEIQEPGKTTADYWRIDAYFEQAPDLNHIHALTGLPQSAVTLTATPQENWVAVSQASLPPVRAGRFLVHGSHDRARAPFGPNTIEIDAGEAFGTAHHATTYLCLEALDRCTARRNFRTALDLGCGTGVLAIALARRVPKCAILATDIDPIAIDVTRQNACQNRVAKQLELLVAPGISHSRLAHPTRYDLIIANILASPLIELAKSLARISKPNAHIILSGLLTTQARQVTAAYTAAGFYCTEHLRRDEWSALVLVRR